uniref:Pericentrin/AKAP-450 centrosomal targeting domain-containing protein n=1 Tax=Sus scrofa TaxID=9823 RepID=A0A8D1M253_PIG
SKKKTAKRKGPAVDAPVQEESAVAAADGGLVGGPDVCSDTPDGGGAAQVMDSALGFTLLLFLQVQSEPQLRPTPQLMLEALRLSLSHAHAAQLERTQAALQREKEAALSELRAALLGRLAQERALLQSGAQRELELVREQHGRETAELKEKLRSEMEKNVQMIETLKQDWESERDVCLENLRRELLEKHQLELENLQNQFQKELAEQRAELEKIFQAPSQAECSPQTPEAQHEAAPRQPHADLPPERCLCLGDVELKFKEKEKENQLELENLRASYEELQARSQEEIRRLGAQLESARSSRQELSGEELRLLARASHLEELEHLKRDFELQQQQERTKHESELEELRVYFEEKLREAERGHQEDLALLEQRLQEGKEGVRVVGAAAFGPRPASLPRRPEPQAPLTDRQLSCCLQVKRDLLEGHQEELRHTEQKIELLKRDLGDREAAWQVTCEELGRAAEERLSRRLLELREQAESEKRSLTNRFELREAEMRQLQDRQAAQILDLEGSLVEQQGRLRQLELGLAGDESLRCSQCGRELGSPGPADQDRELATLHLQEPSALQPKPAQSRLLGECRAVTARLAAEQDAVLREAQETQARQLQLLQEQHQQQVLSVTAELEARHQAQMQELKASLEREQWALSEARAAELQAEHAAAVGALETSHASHLDSLAARHLSEVQALQGRHRRALQLLRAELEEQLREDASPREVLTRVFKKLKLERDEEPPCGGVEACVCSALRTSSGQKGPAAALQGWRHPLEESRARAEVLPWSSSTKQLCRSLDVHVAKMQRQALQDRAAPRPVVQQRGHSPPQAPPSALAPTSCLSCFHGADLKDQILSLRHEVEARHSELERLQQRRERENQEGAHLVAMLRADVSLSLGERRALQDALRRLLGLFGETLKAAVALKSRISEHVGLCLEDESPPDGQPGRLCACLAAPALDETWPWPDAAPPELDGTSPDGAEASSVAEISSHICESFFMSPESTLECEQPVRRVFQSLGLAVDGLLEMVLDSSRQLEEAREIHSRFEEEFSCKKEEMAQVVGKQQELLERLDAEHEAKARLELQLHKAEGIIEGFKEEKASLQEALGQKEASEQGLVVELEGLRQQLQRAARQQAELQEANSALWSQKEALAAAAGEREAGKGPGSGGFLCTIALRRDVESLTQEQAEARKQAEKDRSVLLSQMRALEADLEEQLSRQQACAQQAAELCALRQQLEALDQHLRRQRQFMDEQAVEREHEREDFQQEIQRLEEQLRQAARPWPRGPRDSDRAQLDEEVELLEEKLREKSDGLNELIVKKELADRQVLTQEEEIKRLEEANASSRRELAQLQGELERLRKALRDLEQVILSCRGSPEIEELRSVIETLRQNQERLQRERAEETEQLHEVIEKLQRELSLAEPAGHEVSDGGAGNLRSELLGLGAEGAEARAALEGELHAALEAKEALSRQLAEQERGHGRALAALQQRLRAAEEAAARQLRELQPSAALLEAEVQGLASQIRAFEAALAAKGEELAAREAEVAALTAQRSAHASELEALLSAVARFRRALERQPLAPAAEPPELQRLRAQCVRLGRQLQALTQCFLRCQKELDEQPAQGAGVPPCGAGSRVFHGLLSWHRVSSGLHWAPGLVSRDKEKLLEDCHLRKADLITQVKQLQEKLNHLVCSMSFQKVEMEDFKFQQTLASLHVLENSLSGSSSSSEEANGSPPVSVCNDNGTTWDLTDVTGNQDALIKNKMPDDPMAEPVALQDGSGSLQESLHGCSHDLANTEGPEPVKNMLRTMDLSSWSSPEVARKDSTLEPLPSLPLTPCSDALSQRSLDTSLWDGPSTWLLQADQSGLLCYPDESAAGMAPRRAASPLAADRAPSADRPAQRHCGSGQTLDLGSESLGAPTAGPAAPSAPGGCRQPPGTMKEKGVHPKRVKALLQMVCDESHHILALSECHGPSSILSRGEPRGPLEAASTPVPRKGEKEPSDVALDWRREFLQVVQEAFEKEREVLKARLRGSDPGGYSSVLERLERVVQGQGDLQERSLEHLRLSDRSSLLSEIQALRAQLRLTHLQNQEKLQQLCAALTSAEARGSQQEHQLRRQVELLAYKVEQEKRIASDLQRTLSEEQEKASAAQKLLAVERGSVSALRAELCECRADNERLLRSLNDVQKEVLQLRSVLDSKEEALQAALQQLESQRGKERALQGRLEEERLQHLQREGQSAKTVEELRASLEKQQAQSNQLCVALKHEQTAKDNLRKELQIEASRCEALLAQERSHLSELQRSLEAEQGRSRELAEALHHERRLTERLSRRTQEKQVHEALLQKLKGQEARVLELEAALQTALQRALEAEARPCREEVKREQERELALQHQRDEHKIRQLRARELRARELQAREAARPCPEPEPEPESLQEQQQGLETARQQLLCAAGLLTSFINQTVDRTLSDWTSSNEKAVASLLHTLETLKSDLGSSGSCHRKTAAALQARLVDVLLSDNESLRRALSTVTREKAELCRALSQLERSPRASRALQESCTRRVRASTVTAPLRIERPWSAPPSLPEWQHLAMEKLYLHYLRAESFRKALIYQKKYLLLLIGGFQDSEQETLSMIAHLGVFPSQADKKAPASRPLARFRTAVRVVVAVLRLRFLVKKWQQVDGRGALAPGRAPRPAPGFPHSLRGSGQGPASLCTCAPCSTPSAEVGAFSLSWGGAWSVCRSSPAPNPRSERSLSASQDPERSLTEYIHHLEMIQQRLGAAPPDSTSKKSCQKIKQ